MAKESFRDKLLSGLATGGNIPAADETVVNSDEGDSTEDVTEETVDTEQPETEAGPESDDTGEQAEEVEGDEESDEETPEEETEADDIPDEEGEAPETPEGEPKPEEPDALTKLQKNFDALQAQHNEVLLRLVQERSPKAPSEQPPPVEFADVPDHVLHAALMGAPNEFWQGVSPDMRAKAEAFQKKHAERQIRFARNPEALYREHLRNAVLKDVFEAVGPLMRDFDTRMAKQAVSENFGTIQDPKLQARAKEIYKTLSGSRSTDWSVQTETMASATARARLEFMEAEAKAKVLKASAQKNQQKAAGGKIKSEPKGSRNGSVNGGKGVPDIRKGETLEQYAKRITPFLSKK